MSSSENCCNAFCLVVEDSDTDYLTLERFVRRSNLPIGLRRCMHGDELMAMLGGPVSVSESSATVPAVIVLDLGLSGKEDGRTILQAVRKHPDLKRTPVVVFSASTNPADIDWCYKHGANAYQVKNMDISSFQCVAELLMDYWRGDGTPRMAIR